MLFLDSKSAGYRKKSKLELAKKIATDESLQFI